MKQLLVLVLLTLVLAPTGATQAQAGDVIVSCLGEGRGLYRVSADGTVTTLLDSTYDYPNAVRMWTDNTNLAVAMSDQTSGFTANSLLKVAPDGTLLFSYPLGSTQPKALAENDRGDLLVFSAYPHQVLGLHVPYGFTTVAEMPLGSMNAGAVDVYDGSLLMGSFGEPSQGGILRVEPFYGDTEILAWGLGEISGLDVCSYTGDVFMTRFDAPQLLMVSPWGQVTSLGDFPSANCLALDEETATVWVAGGKLLVRFALPGVPIAVHELPGSVTGVEIYGRRTLHGSGSGAVGSYYNLNLASHEPGDRNQPYMLVASTEQQPPFALPDGHLLPIGDSPLLHLSMSGACPYFIGFQGRLDHYGRAAASIHVPPANVLWPERIYVTGAVWNEASGRISTVLNPVGFYWIY